MLYDRILKLCKLSQLHRSTPDVIQEEKVPDIGTLGLTFMKLLQPKRPLRPRRKGRKRIPVKGLTGQEVKVHTHAVGACIEEVCPLRPSSDPSGQFFSLRGGPRI